MQPLTVLSDLIDVLLDHKYKIHVSKSNNLHSFKPAVSLYYKIIQIPIYPNPRLTVLVLSHEVGHAITSPSTDPGTWTKQERYTHEHKAWEWALYFLTSRGYELTQTEISLAFNLLRTYEPGMTHNEGLAINLYNNIIVEKMIKERI